MDPECTGGDPVAEGSVFISYAQNFEDIMLWRALRQVKNGFYLDVGAHSPQVDSVTASFYARGWKGINFEPSLEWYEELILARPRDINIRTCVGAYSGVVPFYTIPHTGLSTMCGPIAMMHKSKGFDVFEEKVRVVTLAEICEAYVQGPIHFLKIDVEGAEEGVIRGADFSRFRPWIIVVESTRPSTQIETHENWETILIDAEYSFVWFDGLNRFYICKKQAFEVERYFKVPVNVFDCFKLNRHHICV